MTEYKQTLEKINSIKNSIEEIFAIVGDNNETARKFKVLQQS